MQRLLASMQGRKAQRRLIVAWLGLALLGSGCFRGPKPLERRSLLGTSSGEPDGEQSAGASGRSALQAETLAVGQEIIAQLEVDLRGAGLSAPDAQVITDSARVSLEAEAGRLVVPALTQAKINALSIALPAIIRGAMIALSQSKATASDFTRKEETTGLILSTSFAAVNGRSQDLSEAELASLARAMVSGAVQQIYAAGYGPSKAQQASAAITGGAVRALQRTGLSGGVLNQMAQQAVSGAVAELASFDWQGQTAAMGAAVSKAAAGGIAAMASLQLNREQQQAMVAEMSAAGIVGLADVKARQRLSEDVMQAQALELATEAVAALRDHKQASEVLPATLQGMTAAMVGGLAKLGFVGAKLGQAAAAVNHGALAGVGRAGVGEQALVEGAVVSGLMAGSMASLNKLGLSGFERAAALNSLVKESLHAVVPAGVQGEQAKAAVIAQMVQASLAHLDEAGLDEPALRDLAIAQSTKGAALGLAGAGIESQKFEELSALVARVALEKIMASQAPDDREAFKSASGKVTQGLMEGFAQLKNAGKMDSPTLVNLVLHTVERSVADLQGRHQGVGLAELAGELAGAALEGLASGGARSDALAAIKNSMQERIGAVLVKTENPSVVASFASQLDARAAEAKTLADSLADPASVPYCSESYPDRLSDDELFAKVVGLAAVSHCRRTAQEDACPKRRSGVELLVEWQNDDLSHIAPALAAVCRLQRQSLTTLRPGAFALTSLARYVSSQPSFNWEESSGALRYELRVSRDNTCSAEAAVASITSKERQAVVPSLAPGDYYVCLQAVNSYNQVRVASPYPLLISVDSEAPGSGSLEIVGGPYTSQATVALKLTAPGSAAMFISNTAGCLYDGTWEAYATTKSNWSLATVNAISHVYAKFRDEMGNETPCTKASVTHDNIDPTMPDSLQAVGGAFAKGPQEAVALRWLASKDDGSGVAGYEVAIGTSEGRADVKDWTAVGLVVDVATVKDLSQPLQVGQKYYAAVRAKDRAGRLSSPAILPFRYDRWVQEAYIKAPNASADAIFGHHVRLSQDALAVTSWGDSSSQTTISASAVGAGTSSLMAKGAVHLFRRVNGAWAEEAYIKAANANSNFVNPASPAGHWFGWGLAFDGKTLVVGATLEDSNYTGILQGTSVSTDASKRDAGAAYVYVRQGNSWQQEAYIKAANADAYDNFGHAVVYENDLLAVSSVDEGNSANDITSTIPLADRTTVDRAGAVYVYRRENWQWVSEAYLKPSLNAAGNQFGHSMALKGKTLAVGAPLEDGASATISYNRAELSLVDGGKKTDSGAVFTFERNAKAWTQAAYIKAPNNEDGSQFGYSLALSETTLAVGAIMQDGQMTTITDLAGSLNDKSGTNESGAVYVYTKDNVGKWQLQAYIKAPNADQHDEFGKSLALEGDTLLVGVPKEAGAQATISLGPLGSSNNLKPNSGAVYVYKRVGTKWEQEAYLKAATNASSPTGDNIKGHQFGMDVAIYGDTIAVGADNENGGQTTITNSAVIEASSPRPSSGAVFIYRRR